MKAIAIDRRQLVLGGMLLSASALAYAVRPKSRHRMLTEQEFEAVTPPRLGSFGYVGDQGFILPENDLSEKIYSNVRLGVYAQAQKPPIMMLVAYDNSEERDNLQLHRPELCYKGSGFALGDPRKVILPGPAGLRVRATYWTAQRDDREEHVLYWTRVGDEFPDSQWQQDLTMVSKSVLSTIVDSALVRLSIISADGPGAFAALREFEEALVHGLSSPGRRIVFGPRAT